MEELKPNEVRSESEIAGYHNAFECGQIAAVMASSMKEKIDKRDKKIVKTIVRVSFFTDDG